MKTTPSRSILRGCATNITSRSTILKGYEKRNLMRKRICRFYLDGLCLGRGLVHCGVHEREGGCSAGYCDGKRVGECQVWLGEKAEVRDE